MAVAINDLRSVLKHTASNGRLYIIMVLMSCKILEGVAFGVAGRSGVQILWVV